MYLNGKSVYISDKYSKIIVITDPNESSLFDQTKTTTIYTVLFFCLVKKCFFILGMGLNCKKTKLQKG